jgi:hypothetical protein
MLPMWDGLRHTGDTLRMQGVRPHPLRLGEIAFG